MASMLLTPYDGAILGPIAKLLGWIMNGIYVFMDNVFGIENVGLSIILLTIVIYTLMIPFTYKQQKFSKLSQKMQPEIKAVQEKYKNKKDQASMMAMNEETQLIYSKYGISPMGSCWQMLVQMPIWFALYRVFYNVPAYIDAVKDKFVPIAEEIVSYDGFAEIMQKLQTDFRIATSVAPNFEVSDTNTIEQVKNFVIDVISKVPSIDSIVDGEKYFTALESVENIVNSEGGARAFSHFNYIFGLNVSDTPWNLMGDGFGAGNYVLAITALALPIVYFIVQKLSLKLTMSTSSNDSNDMMAQQMKMMNTTMPLMMVFMCFITPVGLGIYWITSSAYRIVQQIFFNRYFENIDLEQIIEKNKDKVEKTREKMGVYQNQIRQAAAMNTRTITNKASYDNSSAADTDSILEKANEMKTTAKAGSLSAKANMVRDYNERNSRK